MAKLTKGYAFAFQVLGYFMWEREGNIDEAKRLSRQYLEDYAYDKIWSEQSHGDRRVLYGIARSKSGRVSDVRSILGIETNEFNPYRQRLIKKGLITGEERGYVKLTLPFFDQYILTCFDAEQVGE